MMQLQNTEIWVYGNKMMELLADSIHMSSHGTLLYLNLKPISRGSTMLDKSNPHRLDEPSSEVELLPTNLERLAFLQPWDWLKSTFVLRDAIVGLH